MKNSREMEMTMLESKPPTVDPSVTLKNMPDNVTLASTPMTSPAWPCVDSPRLPTEKSEVVHRMKDFEYQQYVEDTQFRYDTEVSNEELEDAMRLEILRNRLGRPINATDSDISLDKLQSEGWRRWNTDILTGYQYIMVETSTIRTTQRNSTRILRRTGWVRNQSRPGGGDNNCMIKVDVTPRCNKASEG